MLNKNFYYRYKTVPYAYGSIFIYTLYNPSLHYRFEQVHLLYNDLSLGKYEKFVLRDKPKL